MNPIATISIDWVITTGLILAWADFLFQKQYSKLQIFNAIALAWINNWDNSLDEQMDRTCEEIMTTSSGTGNGKRICDEKWWLFSWIYVLLSNNRTTIRAHYHIYYT